MVLSAAAGAGMQPNRSHSGQSDLQCVQSETDIYTYEPVSCGYEDGT
jgi:hypothetical protein